MKVEDYGSQLWFRGQTEEEDSRLMELGDRIGSMPLIDVFNHRTLVVSRVDGMHLILTGEL